MSSLEHRLPTMSGLSVPPASPHLKKCSDLLIGWQRSHSGSRREWQARGAEPSAGLCVWRECLGRVSQSIELSQCDTLGLVLRLPSIPRLVLNGAATGPFWIESMEHLKTWVAEPEPLQAEVRRGLEASARGFSAPGGGGRLGARGAMHLC